MIALQPIDLAWALGLIGIAVGLSIWQQLDLTWSLLLAAGRTVLQLMMMGYLLGFIFAWKYPGAILALIAGMLTVASIESRNRIGQDIPYLIPWLWGAIFISMVLTLSYTTVFILQPDNWFDPQYLIPLAGIVMGNAMNGAAIAGERLVQSLKANRNEIETHLCLGASPQQAIAQYRREAIRAGLIPTINAMMVVGLVKLPGIITGQLLSGVDPQEAASYQILIMFMLAFATLVTTLLVAQGVYRQFFNSAAQLTLP
ncbi:iron export ABC transporter permease subunit FetB [Acaryochloris sp. IP29b_bin.137]|uniref:ABC transporter permease n=1 Tax=Acaryochloris sp. IP29b_bin.137 TaxID=2969217 RepID=UPI0026385FED|nr:iron export ABC transporter permease subunit FetB [Acaryochloris sp. IP29b_bin.137]